MTKDKTIPKVNTDSMSDILILPKVSEICPLECVYCYEGEKSSNVMSEEVLEAIVNVLESRPEARTTTYIWHGAEPMTAGRKFYEKAVELQKPFAKRHKIKNAMQSNGVLLTPDLADFFHENDFDIGFSLDGPKHLHELQRPYKGKKSTSFEDTMKAVNMMRERSPGVGVIAVLTKKSLQFLDEMYNFFQKENISFKINPIMQCGHAELNPEYALTNKERIYAVKYMFDKWFDDQDGNTTYDSMNAVAKGIFNGGSGCCDGSISCQENFLSVGADGSIFPCSRYSNEDEVIYGNIKNIKDISEIILNPTRQKLLTRYENNDECLSCEYDFLCYSGCMHYAHLEGDIMKKDPNCGSNKAILEHVAMRIYKQLETDEAIMGDKK